MKVLITGASGFIGSHLYNYLQKKGVEVVATTHKKKNSKKFIHINLLDKNEAYQLIKKTSPRIIFHLAAQSLVLPSWKNPRDTLETNIFSTLNLLEVLKETGIHCRLIIVGSSSEYASSSRKITETDKLEPSSPYALSKLAQDNLSYLYFKSYGIDVVRLRPFFIIGPGKKGDVISDLSKGIVAVEKGRKKFLEVGNLETVRDFVDINDAINAMDLISKKGESGEVYNVCSGRGIKIKTLLDKLISLSSKKIAVKITPAKLRPLDEPVKIGDNKKLKKLGWKVEKQIDQSLKEILNYWRSN